MRGRKKETGRGRGQVMTRLLIFCGFWISALWCKSVFFDLFWRLLGSLFLSKVPQDLNNWAIFFLVRECDVFLRWAQLVSFIYRYEFRRMNCSINWSFISCGELHCDSVMDKNNDKLQLVFLKTMRVFGLEQLFKTKVRFSTQTSVAGLAWYFHSFQE